MGFEPASEFAGAHVGVAQVCACDVDSTGTVATSDRSAMDRQIARLVHIPDLAQTIVGL
jgi:hypothetical protein